VHRLGLQQEQDRGAHVSAPTSPAAPAAAAPPEARAARSETARPLAEARSETRSEPAVEPFTAASAVMAATPRAARFAAALWCFLSHVVLRSLIRAGQAAAARDGARAVVLVVLVSLGAAAPGSCPGAALLTGDGDGVSDAHDGTPICRDALTIYR
jgi:hypothetical protein